MGFRTTGVGVALCIGLAGAGTFASQRGVGPGPTAQQAGTAGVPPATGTIVGRVVDVASGQPVSDAQVSVQMRGGPAPAPGTIVAPLSLRLLTGADGRFVARDLPAGNALISVEAPGYLNGSFGQAAPGTGGGRPIIISQDNRVQEAVVKLWKHAAVAGLVTDEGNEPAIRVTVRALRRSFANGRPRLSPAAVGQTDDRGMYRIAPLPPGDYVIVVPQTQTTMPAAVLDSALSSILGGEMSGLMDLASSGIGAEMVGRGGMGLRVGDHLLTSASGASPVLGGDGRMAAYVTQFYPGAASPAEATVVTLGSGETRGGLDIRMPLVPTVSISGVVMGPDGAMGNVAVRLMPSSDNGADAGEAGIVARATTAADGSFLLLGVPAGTYTAKVLKTPRPVMPAGLPITPQMQALMGGGSGPARPSDALTLFADVPVSAERSVEGLAITLSSGATVSGRVEFSGSAARPPLSGLTVSLQPSVGPSIAVNGGRVSEDATFATPGYPSGSYFVNAAGRLPGWFVKSALVNGVDALDQPFLLGTENIGNVVVTLVDRQTGISGTITSATGAPAEGTVILFPANYREWIARGMPQRVTRNTRSQAKGAYTIAGVPAHDYLIVAVSDEALPDLQNPAVYDALARAATSVTLIEGETRTMSIKLAQVVR